MEGQVIAFIGIALCVFLCGLGSAIGLSKTGSASSAVLQAVKQLPLMTLVKVGQFSAQL